MTVYCGDGRSRHQSRAQVNELSLINNSDRPLLLLAGEIVTGGKQDGVVGKDRIIPAHSQPVGAGRVLRGATSLDRDIAEFRSAEFGYGAAEYSVESDGGAEPAGGLE